MHRGLCYVESKFKKHLFFYFFTFKEQPCWLNIPLVFFTFLLFYLFTFKKPFYRNVPKQQLRHLLRWKA